MDSPPLGKRLAAELVGTFGFFFIGFTSIAAGAPGPIGFGFGLFLMVISAVATDATAPWNGIQAPIFIGLFIFTAATVFGPISGGSFNPAVSIAPAIVAGSFSNLWIYLVGPFVGGAIGGGLYMWFRQPAPARA
jgi:glycerol uptake facilitator-like aquaporin